MIYAFADVETGEPVDLEMPVSRAVAIGKVIRRGGRSLRRLAAEAVPWVQPELRFKCWRVSGAEAAPGAPRLDPEDGCPVFSSRRDVQLFLRANPGAEYGDGWSRIKP